MSFFSRLFRSELDGPDLDQPIISRVGPIEGTNISLGPQIQTWWAENMPGSGFTPGDGRLAERVWTSNRCIQMNAQQIASMPLRFEAPKAPTASEPAWCSSPDPHWFPNGISDAIFAIVQQLYGWGYSLQYVTDWYANGLPRTWTVLPSSLTTVRLDDSGNREYKLGDKKLDASRVVQIDRNPGFNLRAQAHGTPALSAYAQQAWGMLAAANQAMSVNTGGIPQVVLKSERKLDKDQAAALQTQWMEATGRRNGAPPVLPPEISFDNLGFNPVELALLENQDFNAKAIATAFGVPAMLLNMAIHYGMTYQNPAALGEMWWRFELRPTAKRIADAFTAQMLPAGQWVWFDAADSYLPLNTGSSEDDEQESGGSAGLPVGPTPSPVAPASPAQQLAAPLTVVGGETR